VNFGHVPKFEILVCDKPTPFKMNLVLDIQMDRKRDSEILSSILLLSPLVILNGPMNLSMRLSHTLKCCNPLIGNTLRYT
jgi:hypothetical protein